MPLFAGVGQAHIDATAVLRAHVPADQSVAPGQLCGALALASVTAVVTSAGSHHVASAAQTLAAYRPGLVLVSIVGGLGLITALSGLRRRSAADTDAELADTGEVPMLVSID